MKNIKSWPRNMDLMVDNYKSEVAEVSGDVISQAQRLWKKEKPKPRVWQSL